MPYYRVFVQGKNFLMKLGKEQGKVEFQTARYVEADNEKDAELKTIDMVRSDPYLTGTVKNEKNDPPLLYIEGILEVEEMKNNHPLANAIAMYKDEE